jgi:hypothetical protein
VPAPTIRPVPTTKQAPQPSSIRRMPIWSRKALVTNSVIAKPRNADPSAEPISSPAASGATGSIQSALRLLAIAARMDALAAAVNKASTASQKSRDLLIPAVTIIPLQTLVVIAWLNLR